MNHDTFAEDFMDEEDEMDYWDEDFDEFDDDFMDEFAALAEADEFDEDAEDEFIGALLPIAAKVLPGIASTVLPTVAKWAGKIFQTGSRALRQNAPKILKHATRAMAQHHRSLAHNPRMVRNILNQATRSAHRSPKYQRRRYSGHRRRSQYPRGYRYPRSYPYFGLRYLPYERRPK